MRVAHLPAGVFVWPPRHVGDPQGSAPLQPRQPRAVGHRMPLVQVGVRVDDLRVLQHPFAEVVHHGGDVADTAQTFIKSRLTHNSVLLTQPRPSGARSRAGGPVTSRTVLLLPRMRLPPVKFKRVTIGAWLSKIRAWLSKALATPGACFAGLPIPS